MARRGWLGWKEWSRYESDEEWSRRIEEYEQNPYAWKWLFIHLFSQPFGTVVVFIGGAVTCALVLHLLGMD